MRHRSSPKASECEPLLPRKNNQAVVLVADRNYIPAAYFVARQALRVVGNAADVVVITTDAETVSLLREREPRLRALLMADDLIPDEVPRNPFRSKVIYARLLIDRLLDDQYARVLYLDCDVWIASTKFIRLLSLDLQGNSIAAARDLGDIMSTRAFCDHKYQLGLTSDQAYLNSGVMLIDMKEYKTKNIGGRALQYIAEGGYRGHWHDQSALNHIVKGTFLEISPLWNWHASGYRTDSAEPIIIHFTGPLKPWNDALHRLGKVYRKTMKQELLNTPWNDFIRRPSGSSDRLYMALRYLKHRIASDEEAQKRRCIRVDAAKHYLSSGKFADFEQRLLT